MKKLLFVLLLLMPFLAKSQYNSIRLQQRTNTTIESHEGINIKSLSYNGNNSYSVAFFNSNYNDRNDITSYYFQWYLSYKGKRVSDYYYSTMRCRTTEVYQAVMWPGEVPSGHETYISVQYGIAPEQQTPQDRRD